MRLEDALERFVVQLAADGRSPHTIAQYRRHVGLLARWLAQGGRGDGVDELSHDTLARFLAAPEARRARLGGEKKATSMNALRSSLRAFFSYVHAAGWSRQNPARLIRRAHCAGPPPRGLGDQDRERLLSTLEAAQGAGARRDYLLFHLLLATGMRLSAALALTEGDVELERAEVTVRRAKGQRVEHVVLGPQIREHLAGYLEGRRPGPLFPGRDGGPITRRHAARRLAVWMQRAGCRGRAHPHALRHDFACRLYRRTGDVLLVQQALGHRSISSTTAYAHTDQGLLRALLESRAPKHCPVAGRSSWSVSSWAEDNAEPDRL